MARIAGIDLPVQKRLWIGLTSIYGIGRERAKKLAAKAGVDHTKKIRDLTEEEINHIRQAIEQEGRVEGRSEEHTSELQSLRHLVCRLLLEKKKKKQIEINDRIARVRVATDQQKQKNCAEFQAKFEITHEGMELMVSTIIQYVLDSVRRYSR